MGQSTALQQWEPEERAVSRPVKLSGKSLADVVKSALRASAQSPHTWRSYEMAIGYFLQFVDQERGDRLPADWRPLAKTVIDGKRTLWEFSQCPAEILKLIDADLLDSFRAHRLAIGDSKTSAAQRLYGARTLLNVAFRLGIIDLAAAAMMTLKPYKQKQKRNVQPVGRRLTPEEARLLRAAPNVLTSKGQRDLAILDLMLYVGSRCEETCSLTIEEFKQDGGRWWLSLQKGKGDKPRRLKIPDVLYRSLTAWLVASGRDLNGKGPVFFSVNKGDKISDTPINTSVVGRLVPEYGAKAGLAPLNGENRLSPHDLRRTCARNAYDNGASLLKVQQMLGHSSPDTTAHYIGAHLDDSDTATDYVRY